jgi:hypothetical protein
MNKMAWIAIAVLFQGCTNFSIDNIIGTLENKACDSFVGTVNLDGKSYDFSVTAQPTFWTYGTASNPAREEIEINGMCKVGQTESKLNQKYSLTPYVLRWTITVENSSTPKLVLTQGITR